MRLLRLLAPLPLAALHRLGSVLGWLIYGISPTYRRHLRENLAAARYDDARLRRRAIAAAGQLVMELPALWLRPHEQVVALVKEIHGDDAVLAAQRAGKAILFLTPHMGAFEVAAQYAASRLPITVLYRRPKLGWLEPLMRAGRERANVRLVPADLGGVREVFKALERGEAVGFLPDQVPGAGEGEWSEFFGRPAYTMTLAAKLAARDNVACFLAFARRLPRGAGYSLLVQPLVSARAGESATRRLNRALEELVALCPEQYLWGYNRYKAPKGAKPVPA
ncbi:MAG: lysophospholipid acyltransferase family protein [Betaproteobacteria bacterium]|nr:MAG: lysophospholipid acyltransferase family protein [Betaproteobacteria bacterium]TMH44203.1 MAG: lysophospholipid acyltransferase family protein [Betaproteobacteria bacterium]